MCVLFMAEHHLCWRSISSNTSDDPAAAAADITCCLLLFEQRLVPLQLQQHMYAHIL